MVKPFVTQFVLACFGALTLCSAANAVAVPDQGTWGTTLQGRDLDGNLSNGFEAYFDTTQNLTWLADANYIRTVSGGSVTGQMKEGDSYAAAGIDYFSEKTKISAYGIDGWRLPDLWYTSKLNPFPAECFNCVQTYTFTVQSGKSEYRNLFEQVLGNRGSDGTFLLTNTGPFRNVQSGGYLTQTPTYELEFDNEQFKVWQYNTATGEHVRLNFRASPIFNNNYAMWVKSGDIAAVPEPSTILSMLAGLIGLTFLRKRRVI